MNSWPYRLGFADGLANNSDNCPFPANTERHAEYQKGYAAGAEVAEGFEADDEAASAAAEAATKSKEDEGHGQAN